MRFSKWLLPAAMLLATSINSYAENNNNVTTAIDNGLRYLESVQMEYGEFPTTFTPNIPEPQRSLQSSFDSNLFTTAMLADALHSISDPRVERMQKKTVAFLQSQLVNQNGLWSYFTTHNPRPLYPNTIYDLDDTAFASIVLQQNNISFPDNRTAIKANKNAAGIYLTFIRLPNERNSVDCGVNANVLSYLHENDAQVCGYINEQVAQGNNCAVYYTLPDAYYLITRAYASGISCLKPSIPLITNYVIAQFDKQNGSVDNSPFKTAIALNTLISSAYHGPEIQKAKQYLLNTQSPYNGSWPADDFWLWAGTDDNGNPVLMGRSSSSALTTAIVLKALNALQA
jgi:hypothetical protein